MDKVVHFEIPFDDKSRAMRFYGECFGWKLTDILVTHHHGDHTGGIAALKQSHKCRVVAPQHEASRIPAVDETLRDGGTVRGVLSGKEGATAHVVLEGASKAITPEQVANFALGLALRGYKFRKYKSKPKKKK